MMISKKIIVALFGRKRPAPTLPIEAAQSLLIRPIGDAVGDTVAHIAYAHQLKQVYPNIRIGMITTKRNRAVAACSPDIDEIIDDKILSLLPQRKRWDILLDAYESFTSKHMIIDAFLSPQIKLIFKKRDKKYYSLHNIHCYDYNCSPPSDSHIADYLLHTPFAASFQLPPAKFFIPIPSHPDAWPTTLPCQNKIRIFIAPKGSVWQRSIPVNELAQILNQLDKNLLPHVHLMLCNTPGMEEYHRQLTHLCDDDLNISLSALTDVATYISTVAHADIVLSVDSGTVHLACAFGKPLLSFYANFPENISMWHPKPQEGVNQLMLIANTEVSRETHHFPCAQGAAWLNQQIHQQMRNHHE